MYPDTLAKDAMASRIEKAAPTPLPAAAEAVASTDAYSIHTRDLSLWYGDFQALKNVTINIRRGIITSLIGPSGCGKTTLLRCFNRINERYGNVTTTGEITILGKNIYDENVSLSELRKTVGMVFQRPNPLPISIYENVVFGIKIHSPRGKFARAQFDELVEKSLTEVFLWNDVKDRLRKKATLLTLEQQQKLCIARLLPLKPRVILMDEPCSALDAEGTEAIETLIDGLREKYTIVIVTHNMAQARRASDECIYMLLGEIIEHGPTSEIFLSPKNKQTEMYIEGRYG
jgi:phosphate transport system ATP-binding protein